MIVGAEGLANIANGSQLRLHLDGWVEVIEEAPAIAKMIIEQA